MLSAVAYTSQFLHYYYIALPEAVDESPADLMQDSVYVSPLPSAQPFQPPSCGGCAFSLERGAELPKMTPFMENFPALSFEAVRSDEEVLHSDVNAYGIATFRFWHCSVYCYVEKEGFVPVNQDCIRRFSVFEKLSLIFSYIKLRLNSPMKRGDGCIDSIWLVDKSKKPFIQIHRSFLKLKEFPRFCL